VRLAAANTAAAWRTDRHRGAEGAAATIADTRQFADDLVVGRIDVIDELDLRDRAQAVQAHADGGRDDAAFGDRRVEHAMFAVLALQPIGGAKHAAEVADVLAHQHHALIASHHDVHGGVQRLDHVHLSHFCARSWANCKRWRARLGVCSLKTS
jgi:hypothetical protein